MVVNIFKNRQLDNGENNVDFNKSNYNVDMKDKNLK